MSTFEDSILRVMNGDTVVGAAFLVSDRLVATCAHVVQSAGVKVGGKISMQSADGMKVVGVVEPEFWRDVNAEDISILKLEGSPSNLKPLVLGSSSGTKGRNFSTFGFPNKGQELSGRGEIVGQATIAGKKVLQLRSPEVTPGFSGAPIFDEVTKRVVGMVVAITPPDGYQRLGTTAFAIRSETLHDVCEEILLETDSTNNFIRNFLERFIAWSLTSNESFSIPTLNVYLPISKAWARLTTISLKEKSKDSADLSNLAKHVSNYKEWFSTVHDLVPLAA